MRAQALTIDSGHLSTFGGSHVIQTASLGLGTVPVYLLIADSSSLDVQTGITATGLVSIAVGAWWLAAGGA